MKGVYLFPVTGTRVLRTAPVTAVGGPCPAGVAVAS
jgi:hypothetical protein